MSTGQDLCIDLSLVALRQSGLLSHHSKTTRDIMIKLLARSGAIIAEGLWYLLVASDPLLAGRIWEGKWGLLKQKAQVGISTY
jgi:hypothetical protein